VRQRRLSHAAEVGISFRHRAPRHPRLRRGFLGSRPWAHCSDKVPLVRSCRKEIPTSTTCLMCRYGLGVSDLSGNLKVETGFGQSPLGPAIDPTSRYLAERPISLRLNVGRRPSAVAEGGSFFGTLGHSSTCCRGDSFSRPNVAPHVSARRRGGVPPLGSFAAQGRGRNSRAHHGRAARSAMRSGRRPVPGGGTPPRRRARTDASTPTPAPTRARPKDPSRRQSHQSE
jgi:hypothetical protein